MGKRRVAFWFAVAGVSIMANFALELVNDRVQIPGLAMLTAYTHKGAH